jgi:hypothetical protein
MEGEKGFQPRELEQLEQATHVETFSGSESRALVNYLKAGGILSNFLGPRGILNHSFELHVLRNRQKTPHGLNESDIQDISMLTKRLDAMASYFPESCLCRFVNVPEDTAPEKFLADILASGGVSEGNASQAASENKLPVIYCDNLKVDAIVRGDESISHKGRGFSILVYDAKSLRRIPNDEEDKYALHSPYALAPAKGKTFSQALRVVLSFYPDKVRV